MDPDLAKKDFVYFNPGKHDKSFKIKCLGSQENQQAGTHLKLLRNDGSAGKIRRCFLDNRFPHAYLSDFHQI